MKTYHSAKLKIFLISFFYYLNCSVNAGISLSFNENIYANKLSEVTPDLNCMENWPLSYSKFIHFSPGEKKESALLEKAFKFSDLSENKGLDADEKVFLSNALNSFLKNYIIKKQSFSVSYCFEIKKTGYVKQKEEKSSILCFTPETTPLHQLNSIVLYSILLEARNKKQNLNYCIQKKYKSMTINYDFKPTHTDASLLTLCSDFANK